MPHRHCGAMMVAPMKTATYGRMFFGASAALFGFIALLWHDTDTWQNLQNSFLFYDAMITSRRQFRSKLRILAASRKQCSTSSLVQFDITCSSVAD